MNIENLQLINKNMTSKAIFELLSNSRPISNETNIESFKTFLKKRGFQINDNEFYQVFDELEEQGVGFFSSISPDKFIWQYNLKDVSEQIVYPNKKVDIKQEIKDEPKVEEKKEPKMANAVKTRRPGRPPGAKNKPKGGEDAPHIPTTQRRPTILKEEKISNAEATKEVVFFFKTKRGRMVPLSLDEAENLIEQINQIRAELTG